ncbi:RNA polymerase sigma-54 factor 1 [Aquisphaera giovannonii]|uniref:RNA polymerase sigma-54 factor 1 n=1 Tax=Aquisphaera giovannonii TaxID=406548 RepID=A0A5B9W479_9BACT|nr:RNA polymerase factor sigma-54 [Aquisphaera giovannonii]QEH35064.1 RNA polymerase sigma-54 factor 1 [Aquisphaera giovannonii]
MRLDTSQQMRTEMRLRMAPRMIQSMEILQLPIMALQEKIEQELSENPMLVDLRESSPTGEGEGEEGGAPAAPEPEPEPNEFDSLINLDENWSELYDEGPRRSRASLSEEGDRKQDAMQNMASRPRSFHDSLTEQLCFDDCDPVIRQLAEYIIYNLDDNGYLKLDLHDVIRDFGGEATLEQAEEALRMVQKLDPPGVGARDLRECLLLQLTPETPSHDVLRTIISNHLDDLQHNRLPAIEKKTGYPLSTIKEALEHLRRLNPKPGASFAVDTGNKYVVPDLIVEADEHGNYEVRLVDDHMPHLSISRYYQKQLRNKSTDPAAREFIQKRIQSARWLIESIEQRRNTLLKVARAIIEHQKVFLDKGPEFIEPLKMQQIADRVGVHVTTVSRAVDDKWVQTPRGIFPLKRFFGGGTTTAGGEEIAWDTIKQKLLEIIAKEDKSNPLSDEEIVEEMRRQELVVARRTVTKYRQALNILSSRQRRQF